MSSCTLGCLLRELKVLREKSKLCDSLLEERKMLYEMLQNEDLKMDELAQTLKDQAEEIKKLKDENLELKVFISFRHLFTSVLSLRKRIWTLKNFAKWLGMLIILTYSRTKYFRIPFINMMTVFRFKKFRCLKNLFD